MEPPNNESIGTANFFIIWRFFFIEGYKSIEEYVNGTLEKFHYERFFTIGGFIIGGATVCILDPSIVLQCSAHSGSWWSLQPSLEPVGHHSLANNHYFLQVLCALNFLACSCGPILGSCGHHSIHSGQNPALSVYVTT